MAHGIEDTVEAQVIRDRGLQGGELVLGAAHEIEHVLGGTHRALDAAQRVACQEFFDALDGQ